MKKIASAALLFALLGTAVAVADPHEDREALMKQNGAAVKALGGIASGTYDAAAAKAQTQILIDNAAKIPGLFPPGSDAGDPHALPTIWTDPAGFKAASDKFGADAMAAQMTTDGPGLAAALKTVQGDCGGCHKTYRAAPAPAAKPMAMPMPAP